MANAGSDSAELIGGSEDLAAARQPEDRLDLADPMPGTTMFYTSGTTGRPKGVLRSAASAASMLGANIYGYDEGGGDIHLCTGPLHHAAPLSFSLSAPITYGASVVLMERFDAAETLRLIERHQVTHTHMVPTMFHRLLALPAEIRDELSDHLDAYVAPNLSMCVHSTLGTAAAPFGPVRTPGLPLVPP